MSGPYAQVLTMCPGNLVNYLSWKRKSFSFRPPPSFSFHTALTRTCACANFIWMYSHLMYSRSPFNYVLGSCARWLSGVNLYPADLCPESNNRWTRVGSSGDYFRLRSRGNKRKASGATENKVRPWPESIRSEKQANHVTSETFRLWQKFLKLLFRRVYALFKTANFIYASTFWHGKWKNK